MLYFGETTTAVSRGVLWVSCDYVVDYEQSDNEPFSFGYPAYWDDVIWHSCCNHDYKIYGIYAAKRPREQCNRITDYKQIWGLLNLPKGLAESIAEHGNNKIYLGMAKETTDGLSACDAPIRLLIPSKLVGHLGEIWQLFLSNFCTACNDNWVASLKSIVCEFPQVVALVYQCSEMISLAVICDNPKAIQDHFHAVPISKNTPSFFRQLSASQEKCRI